MPTADGYAAALDSLDGTVSIVALADVYDALTTQRVYKPAMSHDEARRIIEEGAGSHFDPQVVEAFVRREDEFARVAAELDDGASPPPDDAQ